MSSLTVMTLQLEPRQALYLLHLPIRTVRILTDPWVDGGLYFFKHLSHTAAEATGKIWTLSILRPSSGQNQTPLLNHVSAKQWLDFIPSDRIFELSSKMQPSVLWDRFVDLDISKAFQSRTSHGYSTLTAATGEGLLQLAEDYFASLGRYVRLGYTALSDEWVQLTEGDGTAERVMAILLGYTIAALLAALYLNTITASNVRSVGRAIRYAVRQQMIVFKVGYHQPPYVGS